jgi:hypothetical protein
MANIFSPEAKSDATHLSSAIGMCLGDLDEAEKILGELPY